MVSWLLRDPLRAAYHQYFCGTLHAVCVPPLFLWNLSWCFDFSWTRCILRISINFVEHSRGIWFLVDPLHTAYPHYFWGKLQGGLGPRGPGAFCVLILFLWNTPWCFGSSWTRCLLRTRINFFWWNTPCCFGSSWSRCILRRTIIFVEHSMVFWFLVDPLHSAYNHYFCGTQ